MRNPFRVRAGEMMGRPDDEVPDFMRGSGDAVCEKCGKTFWKHEKCFYGPVDSNFRLMLLKACDGTYIKP